MLQGRRVSCNKAEVVHGYDRREIRMIAAMGACNRFGCDGAHRVIVYPTLWLTPHTTTGRSKCVRLAHDQFLYFD